MHIFLALAEIVVQLDFALYYKARMDNWTVGGIISKDSAPLSIDKFAWFILTFVTTKLYLRFLISCLVWE